MYMKAPFWHKMLGFGKRARAWSFRMHSADYGSSWTTCVIIRYPHKICKDRLTALHMRLHLCAFSRVSPVFHKTWKMSSKQNAALNGPSMETTLLLPTSSSSISPASKSSSPKAASPSSEPASVTIAIFPRWSSILIPLRRWPSFQFFL